MIPDTAARIAPVEFGKAPESPGKIGQVPLPRTRPVTMGAIPEAKEDGVAFGGDILQGAAAESQRPQTEQGYRTTQKYAQAPKSLIYESGHWTKVQDILGPPDYKSYPPPTAEEIDELIWSGTVTLAVMQRDLELASSAPTTKLLLLKKQFISHVHPTYDIMFTVRFVTTTPRAYAAQFAAQFRHAVR